MWHIFVCPGPKFGSTAIGDILKCFETEAIFAHADSVATVFLIFFFFSFPRRPLLQHVRYATAEMGGRFRHVWHCCWCWKGMLIKRTGGVGL